MVDMNRLRQTCVAGHFIRRFESFSHLPSIFTVEAAVASSVDIKLAGRCSKQKIIQL